MDIRFEGNNSKYIEAVMRARIKRKIKIFTIYNIYCYHKKLIKFITIRSIFGGNVCVSKFQ
jgi:16S rRNA U1498 N3-methylase RsmE